MLAPEAPWRTRFEIAASASVSTTSFNASSQCASSAEILARDALGDGPDELTLVCNSSSTASSMCSSLLRATMPVHCGSPGSTMGNQQGLWHGFPHSEQNLPATVPLLPQALQMASSSANLNASDNLCGDILGCNNTWRGTGSQHRPVVDSGFSNSCGHSGSRYGTPFRTISISQKSAGNNLRLTVRPMQTLSINGAVNLMSCVASTSIATTAIVMCVKPPRNAPLPITA
mmetsp:Transcript_31797/g.87843  ORF Transcript_31797/g.87843 Transcript_31797/m.87843 type:complete len:230 (+) Transcript_31797:461-1150(+)